VDDPRIDERDRQIKRKLEKAEKLLKELENTLAVRA
jgi:F0F1-type ATP synthase membrane subunit b/b'